MAYLHHCTQFNPTTGIYTIQDSHSQNYAAIPAIPCFIHTMNLLHQESTNTL
ncbi:hypothetical protein PILCRDRAFT_6368 [Piloderma croceum F 1598]|uniref:Uncharacterized protein n=1 Tax=Piloderma croceum (strain F 1598) TaxID=765440 RepID=A0A0C3FWT8_PILCF|nr:hypothetical protein PILCRDRAFT_6368 [Piloderma croceum F 1598]